jgi:NDP-sugar pyrophosphorylase family protein
MINVLMPLSGGSKFFDSEEYFYPKMLIEIQGKPMVQHAIENLQTLHKDLNFIFVVKRSDCTKFHLDDTLRLLANSNCNIIMLDHETKGAACSALMAIDEINNDHPLIISNFDQIIDSDLAALYSNLETSNADAGCLVFDTTHPRWSFVLLDDGGFVVETAEKRPLSRNAIAGFYYYKHGKDFVGAAQSMIRKLCSNSENFFISPTFNELILANKKIKALRIPNEKYHSFYTPQKIEEYEKGL